MFVNDIFKKKLNEGGFDIPEIPRAPVPKPQTPKEKDVAEGSAQDKLHRRHQELRKKSGLPDPDYYKELKASYDIENDSERLARQAEIKKKYQVSEAKTKRSAYKGSAGAQAIAQASGVKNVNRIVPGQQLNIPGQATPYIVQKGDTLDAIASRFAAPATAMEPTFTGMAGSELTSRIDGSDPSNPDAKEIRKPRLATSVKNAQRASWGDETSDPAGEVVRTPRIATSVKNAQYAGRIRDPLPSDTDKVSQNIDGQTTTTTDTADNTTTTQSMDSTNISAPALNKRLNFVNKEPTNENVPSDEELEQQGREENRFPHFYHHKNNTIFTTPEGGRYDYDNPDQRPRWLDLYKKKFDMPTPHDGGWWRKGPDGDEALVEQGVAEAGPFSYGAKKPRKGSVAYLAAQKRKEQERGKQPIEPKDQMVGTARVIKDVTEGRKQDFNFDIEDIKKLETIRDLPTLRAQAMSLISRPSARPMKPEKVAWFDAALDRMDSPLKIIKLMYDLLLSGEGHAVIGSKNTMKANTYRNRFGESTIDGSVKYEFDLGNGKKDYQIERPDKSGDKVKPDPTRISAIYQAMNPLRKVKSVKVVDQPREEKPKPKSVAVKEDVERYLEELERAGYEIVNESPTLCPECGGVAYANQMLAEKQDACYHKVKSRYKVWPSAYASGALVRCRKVGAKNWGNKSKK
jgi:hypothetical protein